MKPEIPEIKTWYTVKVVSKFKEMVKEWKKDVLKERTQSFEWLVIKVKWKYWDLNSTIIVRKISDWIWVERVFPLHSTNIVSIEVVKIAKVKRAKLYYIRDKSWKSARLKEVRLTQAQKDEMIKNFDKEDEKRWKKSVKSKKKVTNKKEDVNISKEDIKASENADVSNSNIEENKD